jgi:hypothetical protein
MGQAFPGQDNTAFLGPTEADAGVLLDVTEAAREAVAASVPSARRA